MIGKRRWWRVSRNCIIMIIIVTIHNLPLGLPLIWPSESRKHWKLLNWNWWWLAIWLVFGKTEVECSLYGGRLVKPTFLLFFYLSSFLVVAFDFLISKCFLFGSGEGRSMCRLQYIQWLGQSWNEIHNTKKKK